MATVNETGTVQERFCYDAFGNVNGLNSDWNRTFTGQVFDSETGLMLYRNRFYSTELGRFLQRDPIGYEAGDWNVYRYCLGNPIQYVDVQGEWVINPVTVKIGVYVVAGIGAGLAICNAKLKKYLKENGASPLNSSQKSCINKARSMLETNNYLGTTSSRYYAGNSSDYLSHKDSRCRQFIVVLPKDDIDCSDCGKFMKLMVGIIHENRHLDQWGGTTRPNERDASATAADVMENSKKNCEAIAKAGICSSTCDCETMMDSEIKGERDTVKGIDSAINR